LPVQGSEKPPTNLVLPLESADVTRMSSINAFGVCRYAFEQERQCHGGIDLSVFAGSPIYAVADGVIIGVEPSTDHRPGKVVKLLLTTGQRPGEGWSFLYEHIDLMRELGVGDTVKQGQQIATSPGGSESTNHHLQLAHVFHGFEYFNHHTCWVNQLLKPDRRTLLDAFYNEWRTSKEFIDAWRTVSFDNKLPFRELLNPSRYPKGAQLCYALGTDVR
jgi:hypothetical protein